MPAGETRASVSGWTVDTYAAHMDALAALRAEHDREVHVWREKFENERDRRLTEVAIEREKALKIKETADLAALSLAREIQDYKDEKANELREQISGERGLYASKEDLTALGAKLEAMIRPLAEYIAGAQGRGSGSATTWAAVGAIIFVVLAMLGTILTVVNMVLR
jgi:hypothetical protein